MQQVAPHLQLVQTVAGDGTCPAIRVADSSSNGTIWGVDFHGGLWASTDDLATWTRTYKLPMGFTEITHVLPLSSGHLLILALDGSGTQSVFRSLDKAGTAFASNPSFVFPAGSTIHGTPSWAQIGRGIFICNYGTRPNPVMLWKSHDDGVSFRPVFELPGYPSGKPGMVRHFHDVFADPYKRGRIWLTIGDHPGSRLGYSDDGGYKFHFIARVTYPESRAVGLMFSPKAVYWATDSAETSDEVWHWNRR